MAAGDAVGTTVEFKSPGSFKPVEDMTGGGPFRLKPGEWTDDTSMALALADSIGEAIYLGMQRTQRSIVGIYLNLRAMITGRVSVRSMGGPIMIASLAYESAGQSVYDLIFFLGMISINLAVINFLPIPVLDGGHMLFLIWEKIRGVPASQTVQAVATYVGLLVILALMVLTFWVDITRLF